MTLLLLGCANGQSNVAGTPEYSSASHLFTVGYQDIQEIYIDDVPVSELALTGLGGLREVAPGMEVKRVGDTVALSINGTPTATFTAPEAESDAEAWARLTAAAIEIGRDTAPGLKTADEELLYAMMFDSMLAELDGFSRYSGRDDARENRASRDGFGGIGVRIRLIDEGVRVLLVMDDTPAQRAGLEDDDVITHIDSVPTVGLDQRDIVRRLRGPLGSQVNLTVARGDDQDLRIGVVRAHIVPQTVRYSRHGGIVVLQVTSFNQDTTRSLRDKILQAKWEMGPELKGYVLDLRNNPGGLLDQSVAVSDLFIERGRIVSTHGRHPDSHQYFDAEPEDIAEGLPLIVLVNGNSASASEIVAAALQDAGRAVVVGSNSFGKGTVQTVLRLPNEGELTLTWARFHAPSGYALDGRGIVPDICTSDDVSNADQVIERIRMGELPFTRAAIRQDVRSGDTGALKEVRGRCPARHNDAPIDIEVAERLISDSALFARTMGQMLAQGDGEAVRLEATAALH